MPITRFTRFVFFFKDDKFAADQFLKQNDWRVGFEAGIDPKSISIQQLPVLLVISPQGTVEAVFDGILTSSKEVDIKLLLGLPVSEPERLPSLPRKRPYPIFEERNLVRKIELPEKILEQGSGAKFQSPSYKQINDFALDADENLFAIYQEHILKIDKKGNVLHKSRLNQEFNGGFAVGPSGRSYLFLNSRRVLVLNPELENQQLIDLRDLIREGETCVKIEIDSDEKNIFVQTYDTLNRHQKLYRMEVQGGHGERIFQLESSPFTLPGFGPGLFAWTISQDFLYIADIHEYRIDIYSIRQNTLVGSLAESSRSLPIHPRDSEIKSLGLDFPHILKPGAMQFYPAIWDVRVAPNGKVLVFTSERDNELRQVINVYDRNHRLVGTDYQYFRPIKNNFLFFKDLVLKVDCGPVEGVLDTRVSPLDFPALSAKIEIFKSSL